MKNTVVATKQCKYCNQDKSTNHYYDNIDYCKDCISDEDRAAIERTSTAKSKAAELEKYREETINDYFLFI